MRETNHGKTIIHAMRYLECGGGQTPLWLFSKVGVLKISRVVAFDSDLVEPLAIA